MSNQKRFYRRRGFWLALLAILFVPVLLFFIIGQFTPILTIWIARGLIGLVSYGAPANIEAVRDNITAVYDLTYGEEDHSVLDIYYPKEAEEALPVVVYIHGGGFVAGDKAALETFAMSIANEGYVVANINYGLAPEQPYPTAITQINEALRYLSAHVMDYGGDMSTLFIAGNSAGAQLTSQMAAIITDEQLAAEMALQPVINPDQLKGVVLINGIYNMQTLRDTGFPNIELYLWAYTGERKFENYVRIAEISTVRHITPDYPAVFITAGDIDPLEPQTIEMIDVLESNDIEVTPALFSDAGLDHDFILSLDTPHGQETFDKVIAFLANTVR